MAPEDDDPAPEARPPVLDDLIALCQALNAEDARYVVIGGMAVIQAGLGRTTNDIDLLIDASPENQDRVRRALQTLPDRAIDDMAPDDLKNYAVVRVADEIVVDLMRSACGVTYETAAAMVDPVDVRGVVIPFANARLLWRTKDTARDKDKMDRAFLARLLADRGEGPEDP
jgi:hypothetical protein